MTSIRSHRLRILLKLGLGLTVTLVLLFTVEISLRFVGVKPAFTMIEKGTWLGQANMRNHRMPTRESPRGFLLNTNADGLRTHLSRAKKDGVVRVAVMGDSTVYGWGVDQGHSVVAYIQRSLDAGFSPKGGNHRVEVINAAQPGYSTTQVAWLFKKVVSAYRPDRVLVFIPLHDYNPALLSDREFIAGGKGFAAWTRVMLIRHSRIYTVLLRHYYPQYLDKQQPADSRSLDMPTTRVTDAERRQNFDAMRAALARWGGKLMLGFIPFRNDLEYEKGSSAPDRTGSSWIMDYANEHGLTLVDVRACCGPNVKEMLLPDDPGHLNAKGNAAAGAAAAKIIAAHLDPAQK